MHRLLCLTALLSALAMPGMALAHDDTLAHGAKHAATLDAARFVTSRDAAPLPLPEETDAFFFAIIGDRTGGPPEGVEVLAEAVGEINLLEPDLVMTVGDLVQGYNQTDRWMTQMREFKGIMDGLLCPWFPVAGNHDIYWRGPGKPAGEHEVSYETHFGPLWYAFEHKDAWFIVLYSDEANPATGERNFSKPECQVMSDAQLTWLRETLTLASDARHVFVFLHHPRWLPQYGEDWERVHRELVAAGNVRAVFAGHIHRMRHDGRRDGIEYVALATTGGAQEGHAPQAGYLHHYHVVTVRPDQIAMAALPVGTVMDVRAISGKMSDETATLARTAPTIEPVIPIDVTGTVDATLSVRVRNPATEPIEVMLTPTCTDPSWRWAPDHDHGVIRPGESREIAFALQRDARVLDETFRPLEFVVDVDYLAGGARYPIRTRKFTPSLAPTLPVRAPSGDEHALLLDGRDDCLRVDDRFLDLPDGPLTAECWFRARSWHGQSALVSKTERSEFGLFAGEGVPSFWIFLGQRYVTVRAPDTILEIDRWHHLAGVYDGVRVRLYLDGRLVAAADGTGERRTNDLPLFIGAELAGHDRATDHFDGWIDEVRISRSARYTAPRFMPARRHEADDETTLLLHLEERTGPWVHDASRSAAHPEIRGAPVVDAEGAD